MTKTLATVRFILAYTGFEKALQMLLSIRMRPVVVGFRDCFLVLRKDAFEKNWNFFLASRTNIAVELLIGLTNAELIAFYTMSRNRFRERLGAYQH